MIMYKAAIFSLRQTLGSVRANISYYKNKSSVSAEDRKKTLSDLYELEDEYLCAIEILETE